MGWRWGPLEKGLRLQSDQKQTLVCPDLSVGANHFGGDLLPDASNRKTNSRSHIPILMAPVLFAIFFIFAIGEEAGWSGYVIDGLQNRWSALTASIVLGTAWPAWHIVPCVDAHHASNWWVAWQWCAALPVQGLQSRFYDYQLHAVLQPFSSARARAAEAEAFPCHRPSIAQETP